MLQENALQTLHPQTHALHQLQARMQKENYGIRWSWIFGSGIMFLLLTAGWVIGGQQLPEVAFGGIVLGSVTFILGVSIVWAFWRYRDTCLQKPAGHKKTTSLKATLFLSTFF